MNEEWREIPGFALYEASSEGRVRRRGGTASCRADRLVKPKRRGAYLEVTLRRDGKSFYRLVHRVVCETFHGPAPSPEHQAAHGREGNSAARNVRWATKAENEADKDRHGTRLRGEKHPRARLSDAQVSEIRHRGRGAGVCALAREFGVTHGHVSRILNEEQRA